MLPQACLRNPLIPRAGIQTQWRVAQNGDQRGKETREIQPWTIQFFKFLQGSILALFSYDSSICAVLVSILMPGISYLKVIRFEPFHDEMPGKQNREGGMQKFTSI